MSDKLNYVIEDDLHGKRLDQALSILNDGISRSTLGQYIKDGLVTVDDKAITKPSVKVSSGQEIVITLPEAEDLEAKPQDLPLDVVYEDEDLIVINKPIGFVVHPGAGVKDGTVMNAVLYHTHKLQYYQEQVLCTDLIKIPQVLW